MKDTDTIHAVEPGEFLLGYPDNRGGQAISPLVRPEEDPHNLLPVADPSLRRRPLSERRCERRQSRPRPRPQRLLPRHPPARPERPGLRQIGRPGRRALQGSSRHAAAPRAMAARAMGRGQDGRPLARRHLARPLSAPAGHGLEQDAEIAAPTARSRSSPTTASCSAPRIRSASAARSAPISAAATRARA